MSWRGEKFNKTSRGSCGQWWSFVAVNLPGRLHLGAASLFPISITLASGLSAPSAAPNGRGANLANGQHLPPIKGQFRQSVVV